MGIVVVALWLLAVTTWSYWPTLMALFSGWQSNQDYSAGQLVPLVAVFLVWRERRALEQCVLSPCWWAGLPLLIAAQAAFVCGLLLVRPAVERFSVVFTLASFVLLMAGWQVLRRVIWILLFLFLMFPMPGRLRTTLSDPLHILATSGAAFLLEVFGVPIKQQGNIIMLNDHIPMAVAEACSGLRMLTAFVIVAAFIAYMVKRPRWQKGVLLASSIPVAVACNIIRIFLTAMIMLYVSVEIGEKFFHDFAGLVMMPAAVSLIFSEIWLMDRIVVPESGLPSDQTGDRSKPSKDLKVIHARKRPC